MLLTYLLAQVFKHGIQRRIKRSSCSVVNFLVLIVIKLIVLNNHERLRVLHKPLACRSKFQYAIVYPITLEELQNIQGVGAGKARRYGKEFVELIKKHCEENDIERPEDLRVRTVAKKSVLKVKIIQSIDRQIALDDIADAQGIDFEDLLDEVEAIVYSGTKINIDYFLEDVMDDDHVDDIYEYFKESETDDLETAMEELGEDYSEDEIRLVRIKFISDMGN